MKFYASYGTFGYLNQIRLNHPDHHLYLYSAKDTSLIFEETDMPSALKEPLTYEILSSVNDLEEDGFFAVIFIPTAENHAYQLEKRLQSLSLNFDKFPGFKCYRFLKPDKGTTYKIYFGFSERLAYEDFKESSVYQENFSKAALSQFFGSSGQHSSYFERYLYPVDDQ
ncbi:signal transduction protein TRAP [Staphylococcus debuckii]|uniref:signal transduction protein TRAP n=1 Tax=Staphylococcus debuckii TaxID=2044912 RepID=UPI000F434E6C|nr:signal transduction protein TRAP [Staphylococcus debuckii]AYU55560.1 signal transduction protein TRAP [Staphylococcus debuckii]